MSFIPPFVRLTTQEGLPPERVDAYVREHMQRADLDKDGQLSLQEFVLWFLTEVAALLPFKRNGDDFPNGASCTHKSID